MGPMNLKRTLVPAAALLAAGVIGGAAAVAGWEAVDDDPVAATTAPATPVPAESADSDSSESPITAIVQEALPSVVEVRVEQNAPMSPFGGQQATGLGSGWLYDDTHVVTNEHVVDGADSVTVVFSDGTEVDATVVGVDRSTDVAVLELEDVPDGVEPLPVGSADSLQIGDTVIAIGSPMGLQGTVTAGIVSALDRDITAPDGFTIDGAIQTDAALNHGNSGGPLLDADGRVVGMNAQIASQTGDFSGIGYAIPIETVQEIAGELIETGEVEHAFLGVAVEDADNGARLAEVRPGSPADDAGLRQGDVVTAAEGDAIESADDLRAAVEAREPGDSLELTVERGGDERTITVELGTRPESSA